MDNLWEGDFGDDYTRRNRVYWKGRTHFFKSIMDYTHARSIFEFGCNAGWNLSAIKENHPNVGMMGIDINKKALAQAYHAGLNVAHKDMHDDQWERSQDGFELVFTAGVLIHLPLDECIETMKQLIHISSDYILAIEYDAEDEEMIRYRGYDHQLWKRPYGKMYEDLGLKKELHYTWDRDKETALHEPDLLHYFDRCDAWLMRKPTED